MFKHIKSSSNHACDRCMHEKDDEAITKFVEKYMCLEEKEEVVMEE